MVLLNWRFWGLMYLGIWLKLSKRSSNFRDKLRTQTLCIYILLIAWSQKRRKKFISIKGILNHTNFEHCEQATGQEDFKRPISKKNGQVTFPILWSWVKTNISQETDLLHFGFWISSPWPRFAHQPVLTLSIRWILQRYFLLLIKRQT